MNQQENVKFNTDIKNILSFISIKLNLKLSCNEYNLKNYGLKSQQLDLILTDTPKNKGHLLINAEDFFAKHYTPINHSNEISQLDLDSKFSNKIWDIAENFFETQKEKDNLFNFFYGANQKDNFRKVIHQASDEKFFKFLSQYTKFNTSYKNDFDANFPLLKARQFDTQEKINTLLIFSQHFQKIIRRSDIKPTFCDFIANKIPEAQHQNFAKITSRPIILKEQTSVYDLMSDPRPSLTLPLKKDKIFEKIKISNTNIPSVPIINDIHEKLTNAFNSDNLKEKLGLVDTHFVEFMAAHNKGKIVFEFKEENHRKDMPEIYFASLNACASNYVKNNKDYIEIVEKTVMHYLLEQQLPVKEKNTSILKI